MLRIDADAHVLETEETWEFMDGADRKYRPEIVGTLNGSGAVDEYWLVDGTLRLKSRNVGMDTPLESRELRDVAVRLKHMDKLKVDIQVIFPTIFIIPLTPRPEIELALCRSYNRWMGECWKQSDNRLRWVAMVPLLDTDHVYEEARLAKENGAVGIYMRGSEGERLLSDPHFYPVYDAASRLDIPACIHSSNGSSCALRLLQVRDRGLLEVQAGGSRSVPHHHHGQDPPSVFRSSRWRSWRWAPSGCPTR